MNIHKYFNQSIYNSSREYHCISNVIQLRKKINSFELRHNNINFTQKNHIVLNIFKKSYFVNSNSEKNEFMFNGGVKSNLKRQHFKFYKKKNPKKALK